MRQVRSTACKSRMSKTQWQAPKMCQLRWSSPGQFYRLSFVSTTTPTTQFLTSMPIARHEANHTCLPVPASSLRSSQGAHHHPDRTQLGLKPRLSLRLQLIRSLSVQLIRSLSVQLIRSLSALCLTPQNSFSQGLTFKIYATL